MLAYSAWLLEFVMPTGVSPVTEPVEDLLLGDALFRVTTGVAGLAFLAAGPPLMRLVPVHWTGRLTAVTVAAYGILLLVDAGAPGSTLLRLLLNVAFLVGTVSLVLWWPPVWRTWAIGGLALILATWALVLLGPQPWHGVFTRVQLAARAAEILVGGAYVVRMPLSKARKPPAPDGILQCGGPPHPN